MPSKTQLIGGLFQDSEGNALANGYLRFKLSQDGSVTGTGSICAGIEITVQLNSLGSVDIVTPQYIWGNDQISPVNTFYKVTGYTAKGQPAWGPNSQQVVGSGGTFDVGTWVPNQMFSWTPPLTAVLFKTNGVANPLQSVLNLIASTNVNLTSDGAGGVSIAVPFLQPVQDVACYVPGLLIATQNILRYNVRHGLSFPVNFSGSIAGALAASSATAVINIQKNGVTVGTITYSTSAAGTLALASPLTLVSGDYLDFIVQNSDTTLSGVNFTLVATRTS